MGDVEYPAEGDASQYSCVDPLSKKTWKDETFEVKAYRLEPGEFVLASLMESITLPADIAAEVKGKSSLGRLGLSNSAVAGWVDPGWSGVLTIELKNESSLPIILTPGMKIGQLIFYRASTKAHKPYNKIGRYQNQEPATGSKGV